MWWCRGAVSWLRPLPAHGHHSPWAAVRVLHRGLTQILLDCAGCPRDTYTVRGEFFGDLAGELVAGSHLVINGSACLAYIQTPDDDSHLGRLPKHFFMMATRGSTFPCCIAPWADASTVPANQPPCRAVSFAAGSTIWSLSHTSATACRRTGPLAQCSRCAGCSDARREPATAGPRGTRTCQSVPWFRTLWPRALWASSHSRQQDITAEPSLPPSTSHAAGRPYGLHAAHRC